jgi:hypothetical protein
MQNENLTAVEWLVEQMFGENKQVWQKEIDQAIKMERTQIKNAYECANAGFEAGAKWMQQQLKGGQDEKI